MATFWPPIGVVVQHHDDITAIPESSSPASSSSSSSSPLHHHQQQQQSSKNHHNNNNNNNNIDGTATTRPIIIQQSPHIKINKTTLPAITTPTQLISTANTLKMQGVQQEQRTETSKPVSCRSKRKARWKLKFHHQALPPEYLDHYEASLTSRTASPPGPTTVRYTDLPYMGEMTLDNARPRRGRKPKKADICHLIYKNYGTTVVDEPLNLCIRDHLRGQSALTANTAATAAVSRLSTLSTNNTTTSLLTTSSSRSSSSSSSSPSSPLQSPTSITSSSTSSLLHHHHHHNHNNHHLPHNNNNNNNIINNNHHHSGSGVLTGCTATAVPGAALTGGHHNVSMCKFKFTGGPTPTLKEKKVLSVDAGGAFRYYDQTHRDLQSRKKSRKSIAREKLEQTFKEKGFLIQTQQLESAQGATYCKFRQLRKFTRYLFRSWKHYLPDEIVADNNFTE